jgi:F0F1-type ATP synthase membrane subunit b/b'
VDVFRLKFGQASNAFKLAGAALLLFGIVACATVPPVQEMSDARQAIAAAREAGAERYASRQLQQAQDSLETAEGHLQTGTSSAYWQARKAAISAKEKAFDALLTSRNAQDSVDPQQ